ncbi:MAG: hypothetical protein OXK76_15100 [Gammaproteobacteria bacterium]|nr:hypothetical protein [Gammaproteobacteria bacterium]
MHGWVGASLPSGSNGGLDGVRHVVRTACGAAAALEFDFKVTAENTFAVKQAPPWA